MTMKTLSLVAGMALAANVGIAQAVEFDEAALAEWVKPAQMAESSCSVMEPESPQLRKLEYEMEGDTLFIIVEGIGLDGVKHFTFDGKIIDDLLSEGRDSGSVTIEEGHNQFFISVSLPSIQKVVGGIFGVVT